MKLESNLQIKKKVLRTKQWSHKTLKYRSHYGFLFPFETFLDTVNI